VLRHSRPTDCEDCLSETDLATFASFGTVNTAMYPAPRTLIAAMGLALPAWLGAQATHYVGNSPELVTAIQNYTAGDTIEITADFYLGQTLPSLNHSVTIKGNGHTLNGADTYRGFTVYGGNVVIQDLTLRDMLAKGGSGGTDAKGGAGGGGLGAGGALFIRSGAQVTLADVSFLSNIASGGNGGNSSFSGAGTNGAGGGGLAFAGANASNDTAAVGGGDVDGQGGSTAVEGTGNAGFGGGGQGSAYNAVFEDERFGGSGGFGGGGGGGSNVTSVPSGIGGAGGYGGGGASGTNNGAPAGAGGFAGSAGGVNNAGFGGSLGGSIFVMEGAILNVVGSMSETGGTVVGFGRMAAGSAMFLQGDGTLAFAPTGGNVVTIAGQISDEAGTGFPVVPATGQSVGGGEGVWGLAKSDAGTLVLGGANLFTGDTTVSGGTLLINGSTRSVTIVQDGATLGGAGVFHALAIIEEGGILAPGNSPGTMTFAAGLTLENGTVLHFELGTISDFIKVTGGTLTGPAGAGGATLHFSAASGFNAGTYALIDGTGATLDSFDLTDFIIGTDIDGYIPVLGFSENTLSVTFTVVPEPSTYALLLCGLVLVAVTWRRRR